MARIIRIGRPPYPEELVRELASLGSVYHPDASLDGFRALAAAGVDIVALDDELPDDAVLLMPNAVGPAERLIQITDRLLAPGGCPWDMEQTHTSLKRYLLEETYELFDAIDDDDLEAMKEELGDVLLQPVLHAAMERRDGRFDIDDVASRITDKLVHRHPHVFGDVGELDTASVLRQWDQLKKAEKADKPASILGGVPRTMPSLQRAFEVSKRAARTGFDWPDLASIWDKVAEEEAELRDAMASGDHAAIEAEFADLLFALVNVARWLKVEPESALQTMVTRFSARFYAMEQAASKPLAELTALEWDELWNAAKVSTAPDRNPS